MTRPLISVVVPVYNGGSFLAEALASVFTQTYSNIEVIVVNDGSTDDTKQVAESFSSTKVVDTVNAGVSVARNIGVEVSKGPVIAFLDADDWWDPRKLACQIDALTGMPDSIVLCHHRYVFEAAVPSWFRGPTDGGQEPSFAPSAWLMNRGTFDRVGQFASGISHGEDTDWWARATDLRVGHTVVPQALVWRRIHLSNASNNPGATKQGMLDALRASLKRKHQTT